MAVDWRIYFSDGSTFSSADGVVENTPRKPVQVIVQRDGRCGRRLLKLVDWYLWSPTLWRWTDHADAASVIYRAASEPSVVIRAGQYLREGDFEKILIEAYNDPDLPGVSPGEPPHPAWRA